MVIGIGLDLADVSFWKQALSDPTTTVIEGTFTPQEQADANAGPVPPEERFAARFAAKEAAIKALAGHRVGREPLFDRLAPIDIEVMRDPWGRPTLLFHGTAAKIATDIGVGSVHVSLTHEGTFAAAVVVLDAQ